MDEKSYAEATAILEDLKEKGKRMTAEDIRAQKISWIAGMLPRAIKITEKEIADELDRIEGKKPRV